MADSSSIERTLPQLNSEHVILTSAGAKVRIRVEILPHPLTFDSHETKPQQQLTMVWIGGAIHREVPDEGTPVGSRLCCASADARGLRSILRGRYEPSKRRSPFREHIWQSLRKTGPSLGPIWGILRPHLYLLRRQHSS